MGHPVLYWNICKVPFQTETVELFASLFFFFQRSTPPPPSTNHYVMINVTETQNDFIQSYHHQQTVDKERKNKILFLHKTKKFICKKLCTGFSRKIVFYSVQFMYSRLLRRINCGHFQGGKHSCTLCIGCMFVCMYIIHISYTMEMCRYESYE